MGEIFEESNASDRPLQRAAWTDWYFKVKIVAYINNFRETLMQLAAEDPLKYQALKKLRVVEYLDLLDLKVKHNRVRAEYDAGWG